MDAFFDVETRRVPTSDGACEIPTLVRDASFAAVVMSADLYRAGALFAGTCLEPWPVRGRAIAALLAWEHRDGSFGRHAEVALALLARRVGHRPSLARAALDARALDPLGLWPVDRASSSPRAALAASEIWGHPARVAAVRARFWPDRAVLSVEGDLELEIARARGPGIDLPVVMFGARGGRLLRTLFEIDHATRVDLGGRASVRAARPGPVGERLRELYAIGPIAVARADRFRARVPLPSDVGPVHAP